VTSTRKIESNRANAKASTGPRTARGKSKAAQNARRHGLSLSISADPVGATKAKNLAHEIAGEGASYEIFELAHRIAEAEINLVRIRQARHELFTKQALFDQINTPTIEPERLREFAAILPDLIRRLTLIDRYERRALSFRKFAIREFDAACRAASLRRTAANQ
jgi:hypothetical protein